MNPRITFLQRDSSRGNYHKAWPRSLEELQTERSYLIYRLHCEDHKATELLRNIRLLQNEVGYGVELRRDKSRKKQLRYLKSRMHECTEQEKAILTRLGHVTYDIQYRERLIRIDNERFYRLDYYEMQLNATCPTITSQIIYTRQAANTETDGVSSYAGHPRLVDIHQNSSQGQFSNSSWAMLCSSSASSSRLEAVFDQLQRTTSQYL